MLKYYVLMIMKKLDSSVKHWNDTVLDPSSQATRMTLEPSQTTMFPQSI
ncbi:hypothetical protein HCR18_01330 [Wolbachia pipientis]|nr:MULTISPECIES: hypothetical protein [Wolbachia]MBA8757753.1 hypothetical protein [Wolbachia pipientis]MBA8769867.1 hypothetical protein [Wolbachia pipientis]